jgi:hypothetical protein
VYGEQMLNQLAGNTATTPSWSNHQGSQFFRTVSMRFNLGTADHLPAFRFCQHKSTPIQTKWIDSCTSDHEAYCARIGFICRSELNFSGLVHKQ